MDEARHAQALGQGFQLPLLGPVPGDEEAQGGEAFPGLGKAPDQGGDVLYRVQAGGDARIDGPGFLRDPCPGQKFGAGQLRRRGIQVHAVVDGEHPVRGEAPGDQQVGHAVADAGEPVQPLEGEAVHAAEDKARGGPPHIVQLRVAVDGAQEGQAAAAQHPGHEIAPAAVAVDDVEALLPDQGFQLLRGGREVVARHDPGVDAHAAGVLGKLALHEADHGDADLFAQCRQQAQHMGLGAAHVAAADEGQNFHGPVPSSCRDK